MYVAVGSFNILVAALVLVLLPTAPDAASWLSEEEKVCIREKLTLDQAGTGKKVYQKSAIVEAFVLDLQPWLLFILVVLLTLPTTIISNFSAAIIKGFGYDYKTAALLNIPTGMISIITILGSTYAIINGFPRCLSIVTLQVPVLIGAGLMSFYDGGRAGVLAGIYLEEGDCKCYDAGWSWCRGSHRTTNSIESGGTALY